MMAARRAVGSGSPAADGGVESAGKPAPTKPACLADRQAPARYWVTRLPDAPPRRAGREWPVGRTLITDPTERELSELRSDPGYRVEAPNG